MFASLGLEYDSMSNKTNNILHISIFLILTLLWIRTSEYLLADYIPTKGDVIVWLFYTLIGVCIIFIIILISYIVYRNKLK